MKKVLLIIIDALAARVVNPAIDAGLGAVFIPYEFTWEIEIEEISLPSGRFLQLDEFPQLLEYF